MDLSQCQRSQDSVSKGSMMQCYRSILTLKSLACGSLQTSGTANSQMIDFGVNRHIDVSFSRLHTRYK